MSDSIGVTGGQRTDLLQGALEKMQKSASFQRAILKPRQSKDFEDAHADSVNLDDIGKDELQNFEEPLRVRLKVWMLYLHLHFSGCLERKSTRPLMPCWVFVLYGRLFQCGRDRNLFPKEVSNICAFQGREEGFQGRPPSVSGLDRKLWVLCWGFFSYQLSHLDAFYVVEQQR